MLTNISKSPLPDGSIHNEAHCHQTLELIRALLIETLLEEADDSANEPLKPIIERLSQAMTEWENQDPEHQAFEQPALSGPRDMDFFRLLMD